MNQQKREIQAARVKRVLAREMPQGAVAAAAGSLIAGMRQQLPYDASAGFVVYWDYAMAIPRKFRSVLVERARLVYCLYDGGTARGNAKATPCAVRRVGQGGVTGV